MKISLCMIAWNEEELLPVAVRSAEGLADEVIVIDTGSSDRTVEVARELGAVVVEGADRMHKGESRNVALDAATGDWCVILDCDEQIADPEGLRAFLEQTGAQAIYIRLAFMDGDKSTLTYPQMRIWRRRTYRYQYRAHEVPVPVSGWGRLEHTDFVWEHRPPKRPWKGDYSLNRLLLDVEENPDASRPMYYLGREYRYHGKWDEAKTWLERYLESPGCDQADAWWDLALCYAGLENQQEQIRCLHQACAVMPMRRDWWCSLASLYHEQGAYEIATGLLKCALEIPLPENTYAGHYWHGSAIHDLLGRSLYRQERYEEGLPYAEKAIELDSDNERLKKNLLWFRMHLGDMDAFYELYGPAIHVGARHKEIAELVEGPRVLDFGCGTGDLLLILQEEHPNWKLHGVDTSQVAVKMAKKRGIVASLNRAEGTFNTVVLSQVLEHIADDEALVNNLSSWLTPGGQLIVTVPKNGRVPSPDHRREYSEEGLFGLLSQFGTARIHDWQDANRILATVRAEA